MVLQIDIKMLQLMQMLMKSNKEGRAFELACMLQTTKMLQNSIQLAHANNLNTLAERLEQLLEQKLEPEQQQQAVAARPQMAARKHAREEEEEEEEEEVEEQAEEEQAEEEQEEEQEEGTQQLSQRATMSPCRPHTRASPVKRVRLEQAFEQEASQDRPAVSSNPFAKRAPMSSSRPGLGSQGIAKSLQTMNQETNGSKASSLGKVGQVKAKPNMLGFKAKA